MKNANKELELKIVRRFKVAPEVLFDAFTNPEAMRVWWTDDTDFEIDLRLGGQWKITRRQGEEIFVMNGEYLEVERPFRLKYTIAMPQFSPNSDVISIEIKKRGEEESELTFIQTGVDITSELSELKKGSLSESELGWQQGFDLMEAAWKDE